MSGARRTSRRASQREVSALPSAAKRTSRRANTSQAAEARKQATTRVVEQKAAAERRAKTKKWQLEKDPRVFGDGWDVKPDTHKLVLGLDLGTTTGYTATYVNPRKPLDRPLHLMQGQLDLSIGTYDSRGIVPVRLRAFLNKIAPSLVFMERVRYTPPTGGAVTPAAIAARGYTASEFFGGLMMAVSDWGHVTETPVHEIPIGTIKQRATGKGNANKSMVIAAHNEMFGTTFPLDEADYKPLGADNVCDSAFALLLGLEEYAAGLG